MWTEEKANAWIAEKSAAGEVPRIGRIYDALHSISSRDKIWLVEVAMKASVELSLVRDYAQALRAFNRLIEISPDHFIWGAEKPIPIGGDRGVQLTPAQLQVLLSQYRRRRNIWRELRTWFDRLRGRRRRWSTPKATVYPVGSISLDLVAPRADLFDGL